MRAILVAMALVGCVDAESEDPTVDVEDPPVGFARCSSICPDRSDWIRIELPRSDGKGVTISYSCPVDGILTPVVCLPE